MIVELRIRNFAIIEEVALTFGAGLNVLSGETGAGKTIIMSALGLLLGGRASPDLIRADAKEAVVEGMFELQGESVPPELAERLAGRELLIRRIIAEGGRSRVLVNDELATVQTLAKIGAALVQIYGQHEQQTLLRPESHREVLDRYAGLEKEVAAYRSCYQRACGLRQRLADLQQRERERTSLIDLARFRVAELERAEIAPGEDEELARERTVLANATRLAAAAAEAGELLSGEEAAAIAAVARAQARLADAATIDASFTPTLEMLAAARLNLEEAASALTSYAARIEADPARLEAVESRLQQLSTLKRKYGGTLQSAVDTLERSRAELADLDHAAADHVRVQTELAAALDDLSARAAALGERRRKAGADLKRRMEAELRNLGMRAPVFDARIDAAAPAAEGFAHKQATLGPYGCDAIEFHLSPNLGQPPMPLARIASGGELSRVMLALKRLEAQRRGVATLVFDEVDAGIGGSVAQIVGRKLRELARYHQVLCITHLPQIAAFADSHFVVEKEERRASTRSRVLALEPGGPREAELARMLGGQASEKFLRAARELLERAAS